MRKIEKHCRWIFKAILLTLSALSVSRAMALPITGLYYTSSPSSWVGQGQTVLVTPADGFRFGVSRNFDQSLYFSILGDLTNPNPLASRWWFLDFAGPYGQELQPGAYLNATRYPFQNFNVPGLSFYGNGRGDNQDSGYFDVLQATYGSDGSVLSFAADFLQIDENNTAAWSRGSFRYNSDVPLTIPEPASIALVGLGLAGIAFARCGKQRIQFRQATNTRHMEQSA